MRLEVFASAGKVVEVWSERLGEEVIFASDNALLDPVSVSLPTYSGPSRTTPDVLRRGCASVTERDGIRSGWRRFVAGSLAVACQSWLMRPSTVSSPNSVSTLRRTRRHRHSAQGTSVWVPQVGLEGELPVRAVLCAAGEATTRAV